ncbi:MAG: hypothetical protein COA99_16470 [Moraxellaceae bacterium]|nr:MAG: hypothetical protein COA99_16470 [Moraxellaceae bacterium]
MGSLKRFAPQIWLKDYPVSYGGCTFPGRMTVVKLSDGRVLIHSPCAIDLETKAEIENIGAVGFILAPGNYHHLHVPSCQAAFPAAQTYICPGIERKRPDLVFDGILGDVAEIGWASDLEQVVVRGSRFMWEVAFFHRKSRTLVLVDLIENMGETTPGTNWVLRLVWKYVFRMWNVAKPAPEYQLGWKDKSVARESLGHIISWEFEKVVMAHGEPIVEHAKDVVESAWSSVLG